MPYKNHQDYLDQQERVRTKRLATKPKYYCPICSNQFFKIKGRTKATSCTDCYSKYRSLYSLLSSAKYRAQEKDLEFNLDITWAIAQPSKCPHTGIELTYTNNGKNYANRVPSTASIDKINPLGGYTKDNCEIVCWWYNCAKQQFTTEQVYNLCKAVVDTSDTLHAQSVEN